MHPSLRKLKILHAIGALRAGGAETQLRLLLEHIDHHKFEVGVIYFHGDAVWLADNPEVRAFPVEARGQASLWNRVQKIMRHLRQYNPDLVHVWLPSTMTIPAALAARQAGIPLLSAQRNRHLSLFHGGSLRDQLDLIPHVLADRIVSNSSVRAEHSRLMYRIFKYKNGMIIRNAVESPSNAPSDLPPILPEPGAFNILYAGRFTAQKRLDILARAFARAHAVNPSLRLHLCGKSSDAERAALLDILRSENCPQETARFWGFRTDWKYYAGAFDLFALASDFEGMPNVLLEAMQSGLPVLSTNIPEVADILTHEKEAWLVPPGDVDAFSAGITRLFGDADLRARWKTSAPGVLAKFSLKSMVDSYEALYSQMISNKREDNA